MRPNLWLIAGGILSAFAALLHVAIIFGGPDWYRFFGAGERMAHFAERGRALPALYALGIAFILAIWSLYAFSGAGLIRRLPLPRTGLIAIAAIYLARALAALPVILLWPDKADFFLLWSSLIALIIGLTYAIGTWTAWPNLSPNRGKRSGKQ